MQAGQPFMLSPSPKEESLLPELCKTKDPFQVT
jgi:hypothetical protein